MTPLEEYDKDDFPIWATILVWMAIVMLVPLWLPFVLLWDRCSRLWYRIAHELAYRQMLRDMKKEKR